MRAGHQLLVSALGVLSVALVSADAAAQSSAAQPAETTSATSAQSGSVPPSAPFTTPGTVGPLAPPAPPPELTQPPEPGGGLEERFRLIQAKQTVITASKREQRISDVPLTLSAIPADELEGTGQFTLCGAIQYFPGLECRRGAMRKAAVSVRGLGSNFLSNRMLLLIDGRPATDPWTGQFYADETTPLTNLKQIEVIRGPGSALYGSNAFSGVINVLQRSPDDLMRDGRKYGFDVRALAGQYDTYRLQATAAGRAGPLRALVSYYGYTTSGPQLLNDPKASVVDKNEWATVHQVSGKVQVASVGVDVGYTWSNEGRPGGLPVSQVGNCGRCHYTPNDKELVETFYGSAHVDQRISNWFRVYGQVYTNFKRRQVSLQNDITKDLEQTIGKRRRIGAEVRALFSHRYFNFTVGGDAKFDSVDNKNILPTLTPNDLHEEIVGVFADGEVRPTPKLILGVGARYDYYHIPNVLWAAQSSQVSPRASVVYHVIAQLTLRANYGRAFRAPSLGELGISQQMYAATLLGNPYLRAETVDTVEAAIESWPFRDYMRLSLTGFYNHATNLINQEQVGGSTSQFQNIGDAHAYGMEVEAAAQIPQIEATLDIAYQLLGTRAFIANIGQSSLLDYAPNQRLYLRAHKRFRLGPIRFFADFYGLFVGDRRDPALATDANGNRLGRVILPGYFVANARVGAEVIRRLYASVIATNLFNAQYQEMLGFPAPGISAYAELKYQY